MPCGRDNLAGHMCLCGTDLGIVAPLQRQQQAKGAVPCVQLLLLVYIPWANGKIAVAPRLTYYFIVHHVVQQCKCTQVAAPTLSG